MRTAVLAIAALLLLALLAANGLPLGEFAFYVIGIVVVILVLRLLAGGINWLFTSSSRPCPRCGEGVEKGTLDCPHCGFDFRTIGAVSRDKRPAA